MKSVIIIFLIISLLVGSFFIYLEYIRKHRTANKSGVEHTKLK